MNPVDQQRAEFEDWARKQGCDTLMLQCNEAGNYVYKWVHGAWLAWREKDKRHAEQLAALKDLLADADKWAEVHRAEKIELLNELRRSKEASEIVRLIKKLQPLGPVHLCREDAIEVFWDNQASRGFYGDTLLDCFRQAVEAKRATTANG